MAISTAQKSRVVTAPGPAERRAARQQPLLERLEQALQQIIPFGKPRDITTKDKIFLFSQLALMVETGNPLNRSLAAITTQVENPRFRAVLEDLTTAIEEGKPFSEALKKYERQFSEVTISMVRAGELSGALDTMFAQAESFERKKEEFRAMLRKAFMYPLFLMFMITGAVVFVLTFVFPKFEALFEDVWDILPASTKLLMGASRFLTEYWYGVMIAAVAAAVLLWKVFQLATVRNFIDNSKIHLPVLGKVFIMVYTSQMLRTLGFLLQGSVSLLEALTITKGTIRNVLYHHFLDDVVACAQEGKGLSFAFNRSEFLPETVKQVVKTGEDSGKLDFVMLRLADYYDNEIDKQLKLFSIIIEPLALLVMGVVVGFIVMSIVLPIFKLTRAVH